MTDTRFVLLASNLAAAKAWLADRKVHDSHAIIATPSAPERLRSAPKGLDLVVINRHDPKVEALHVEVMKLIMSELL